MTDKQKINQFIKAKNYTNYCEYTKSKLGIFTSCGQRAGYHKNWRFCPYCQKPIAVLFNDDYCSE